MAGEKSSNATAPVDRAVIVNRPGDSDAVPIVYDSPHSGRLYPPDFSPIVPVEQLRGYEDRLVDDLVRDAPDYGILMLAATFPRSYIDPNRAVDDLDPAIAGDEWTETLSPSPYSKLGLELVFRTALDGKPLYERPLGRQRVLDRIEACWRPYHDALEAALADAQRRWGAVWHIAWHSMRPIGDFQSPDPGETRPDLVVSDRDGSSSEPEFSEFAVETLRSLGYSVAVNHPFKGGYITERYGQPELGRHSLQIEINRSLYLDLETLELLDEASALRSKLKSFSQSIARFAHRRAQSLTTS